MITPEEASSTLNTLGTAGGLVSVACAIYVALRDARWRKTGLFAKLVERIEAAEAAAGAAIDRAGRWHETIEGKTLISQVDQNSTRVSRCETQLEHMATSEDLARLQGAIGRVEATVAEAASGIDRIENVLIRKALNA